MNNRKSVRDLVTKFVHELEQTVVANVEARLEEQFPAMRKAILAGAESLPRDLVSVRRKPGPKVGTRVSEKGCPICGTPNKGRRFSYYCGEHRAARPPVTKPPSHRTH